MRVSGMDRNPRLIQDPQMRAANRQPPECTAQWQVKPPISGASVRGNMKSDCSSRSGVQLQFSGRPCSKLPRDGPSTLRATGPGNMLQGGTSAWRSASVPGLSRQQALSVCRYCSSVATTSARGFGCEGEREPAMPSAADQATTRAC